MQLELSDEQVDALVGILDAYVSDLSPEIADTGNPAYRADLKRHREVVLQVRSQLPGA